MLKISHILVRVTKIFFTLLCVVFLCALYIPKTQWFNSLCKQYIIAAFNNSLDAELCFEIQTINPFKAEIIISELTLVKNAYSFFCSTISCHFSWNNLFKSLLFTKDPLAMRLSISDSSVFIARNHLVKSGSTECLINLNINNKNNGSIIEECKINGEFDVCYQDKTIEHCFLFASLIKDKGHCKLTSKNNSLLVEMYKDAQVIRVSSVVSAKIIKNILPTKSKIEGILKINSLINVKKWCYKVRAQLAHFSLQGMGDQEIKFADLRIAGNSISNNGHRLLIKDHIAKQDLADCIYKDGKIRCLFKVGSLAERFYPFRVPCDLKYRGEFKDNKLSGIVTSTNVSVMIPSIHNVLKRFTMLFHYDFKDYNLKIDHLLLGFNKGAIVSKNILLPWNFEKVVIPFKLSDLFFSFNKNFFVYLNGQPNLIYENDQNGGRKISLTGKLNSNKGGIHYKASSAIKSNVPTKAALDIHLDLEINSKNIRLKHQFAELVFATALTLKGTAQKPLVSGMISITDGVFKFPFKNLAITAARIYVSDLETILDVNAKGLFNKHQITMRILGQLSHPRIIFESDPVLSTEQIISLLVTGSSNTALNCFVPNFLIQHFGSLLFDSLTKESCSKNGEPAQYIKQILNVVKKMRVREVDDNHTNDNGKYVLELDISDGLRATIGNDFRFEQPKKIGLEYDLSQNITLKGSKDRDNNVGGELEFKVGW